MSQDPLAASSRTSEAASATGLTHLTPYPEWAEPSAGVAVRQGDVISAVQEGQDLWRQLLVVITADCDLARSKHHGALTCVPLLPLRDYLLQFRYDRMRDSLLQRVIEALLKSLRAANPDTAVPSISPARMRQWLAEEEAASILDALEGLNIPGYATDLINLAHSLSGDRPSSVTAAADSLAAAKVCLGDVKTMDKARSVTSNDLASTLKSLPGDALFLNEVSAAHSEGYIVYLRRVLEVADESVATSFSRLPHDALYVRISRLRPPYVYALTQQFAAVFSAIGLPTAYEQARDTLGDRIRSGDYS